MEGTLRGLTFDIGRRLPSAVTFSFIFGSESAKFTRLSSSGWRYLSSYRRTPKVLMRAASVAPSPTEKLRLPHWRWLVPASNPKRSHRTAAQASGSFHWASGGHQRLIQPGRDDNVVIGTNARICENQPVVIPLRPFQHLLPV